MKQHLPAIRSLCDWLVVHQVLPSNPAASVRGPKHVVTKGATPVLTPAETRSLLDRIDLGSVVGLRDRALLNVLVYSFARGERGGGDAAPGLLPAGRAGVAAAAREGREAARRAGAEEAVEACLAAAGIEDAKTPLFQSVDRAGRLSGRLLGRRAVLAMIERIVI